MSGGKRSIGAIFLLAFSRLKFGCISFCQLTPEIHGMLGSLVSLERGGNRIVVNHCLENKIGTVVFGWNKGQKQDLNLGTKINQSFVQIPTARLKERIKQLCEQYDIVFVETEEAYTSAASFLDGDSLPIYGEKPDGWKASGKRIKRGLYRTAHNLYINADCNGSANIIRKVSITLGINLGGVSRGALTTPLRIQLWIT